MALKHSLPELPYSDIHTHILPGIDDGSENIDMSLQMLRSLKAQSVKNIALTPHFYTNKESMDDFLKNRNNSYELLKSKDDTGLNLTLGAEVFISKYILNYDDLIPICIGNTNYMLTEFSYSCPFDEKTYDMIEKFLYDYKVKPIIAHIERYPALMNDISIIEDLVEMGCKMQINLGTMDSFMTSRFLIKLIKKDLVHFVGTDCHRIEFRPPIYDKGMSVIIKKAGIEYAEKISDNSMLLFG